MRVNRSMFVGLLALVAAVGMLGVNGYNWWLSKSRQTDSLEPSTHSRSSSPKSRADETLTGPVWKEAELWDSPYRDLSREPEENTPARRYFPHHPDSEEIAQAEGWDAEPGAETGTSESAAPPLLLPHSPSPIAEPPANDWLSELVKQEFPEANAEERGVWSQELRGLDPEMAREILRMRKSVMSQPAIPHVVTRPHSLPGLPPSTHPGSATENLVPPPMDATESETPSIAERLHPSMTALEAARNVALNNLVNLHTPGFKRARVVLADRSYQSGREDQSPGASDAGKTPAVAVGRGVNMGCTLLDVSQGPLEETKQPLDVAIQGRGFFPVRVGKEIRYTRFGMWAFNKTGELCVIHGDKLCPLEPAITIPETTERLLISSDGDIGSLETGVEGLVKRGRISLVRFINPSQLDPRGNQFYAATKASGRPMAGHPDTKGLGTLQQGFLELSNVSRNEELENFQRIQTHLQLLKQMAGSSAGEFLPGPVARRLEGRTKRASAKTILVPRPALKSFRQLQDRSRNLIEDYLHSERMQSIKRTLGLK